MLTKEQKQFLEERIVKLLEKEPTLTNEQLKERFNCTAAQLFEIRKKFGFPCERFEFISRKDTKGKYLEEAND